jgi:hypothetical protein
MDVPARRLDGLESRRGGLYRYRTVAPGDVDGDVQAAVRGAYWHAADALDVEPDREWVRPTGQKRGPGVIAQRSPIAGRSWRGTIWVRADRPPKAAAETTLHEMRHAWQREEWGALTRSSSAAEIRRYERDAARWARSEMSDFPFEAGPPGGRREKGSILRTLDDLHRLLDDHR